MSEPVEEDDVQTVSSAELEEVDGGLGETVESPAMVLPTRPPSLRAPNRSAVGAGTSRTAESHGAEHHLSGGSLMDGHPTPSMDIGTGAKVAVSSERLEVDLREPASSQEEGDASIRRLAVLRDASARVRELIDDASSARVRDTEAHLGPPLPRRSSRRDLLRQVAHAPTRTSLSRAYRALLSEVDSGIARIAAEVTENPLWIAADYLERHTKLEKVDEQLAKHERVQHAEKAYQRAEKALLAAKSRLDRWRRGPRWARTVDKLLPSAWRTETRRHANMALASRHLVDCEVERQVAEAYARAEYGLIIGERNGMALARQKEAQDQRDSIERHLREAVMHRHLGECIVRAGRCVQHLKDAPANETLEYAGTSRIGPFAFEEFRSGERAYLADAIDVRETLERLDLACGDRVAVRGGIDEGLRLEVQSRGDVWSGARSIEGDLVEIDKVGQTIRGIKLRDPRARVEKWVRPREGDDLGKDLSPAMLGTLKVGDRVQIEGRGMFVRPESARSRGR